MQRPLSFVMLLAAAAVCIAEESEDENLMACAMLFKPELAEKRCCNSLNDMRATYEDCKNKSDSKEMNCETSKCVAEVMGITDGDNIDEEKTRVFMDELDEKFPEDKPMTSRVREQCLDKQYDLYPPHDACPTLKFHMCAYLNSMISCPNWNKEDGCGEMEENASKCKEAIEKLTKDEE